MGKSAKRFLVLAIICTMIFGAWATVRFVKAVSFDMNCNAYIHRAAVATEIETAKVELAKAIEYIEENSLTEGTVSIFLKDPRNDVGFWYGTLKGAYKELDTFSEGATQLEKSNSISLAIANIISLYFEKSISVVLYLDCQHFFVQFL